MFDLTRNQWFVIGMVLLLFGVQFRMVEAYTLTPEVTQTLEKIRSKTEGESPARTVFIAGAGDAVKKTVAPPDWIGWAAISIGAVIIMHSLTMRASGG